jgi:type IV pilus assembly protein PilC
MPVYRYKAIKSNGETIQGKFSAKDRSEILQMLHKNHYYPIQIKEVVEGTDLAKLKIFNKIKIKDIAVFARQFYAMLNAGVAIVQCLDILRKQTENKPLRERIRQIYEAVQKGSTLSEAFKNHRDVFPEILIHMIEAGEVSGNLDTIMDRMATHFEKETRIQNKIRAALTYPIILALVSIGVVVFLLAAVMPTFIDLFEGSDVPLPGPTRLLMSISYCIQHYWYLFGSAAGVIAYIMMRYFKTDAGRLRMDKLKLKLPVVKTTVVKIAASRFARSLSILLASGIPMLQSMDIVAKVIGNRIIADGILGVKGELRKGYDLACLIRRIGIFPPMVDSMIKIGQESGTLDDMLGRTADFYDEEVEVAIQKMTTMLEPLMIVVMAFVIGFIVIAMILPMFDMMNTLY